ncbi:LPS-assembly protein LptD [Saccharobesus litoralis]|nr:LPS assembly protein LptD [Saccharobesus litoralis]
MFGIPCFLIRPLVSVLLISSAFSLVAAEKTAEKVCFAPETPQQRKAESEGDSSQLALDITRQSVVIEANSMKMAQDGSASFHGQVNLTYGDSQISANTATTDRDKNKIIARGGIQFDSDVVEVTSRNVEADMTLKSLEFVESNYRFKQTPGHGSAKSLKVSDTDQGVTLSEATYTSCPPSDEPEWQLRSSEIFLSAETERGEAWHSRVEVLGVPVLYLPYVSFPLSEKRASGFLMPEIGSSSQNGADILIPYYWNLAPNYDATTELRMMTNRGLMLNNEARYMGSQGTGMVTFHWLNNDKSFNGDARNAMQLMYNGQAWDDWQAYLNINNFSDDSFVSDFGFLSYNRVDTHIESVLSLYQQQKDWSVEINVRQFEVFGDHLKPYRALPEVKFEYFPELAWPHVSARLPAELVYFDTNEEQRGSALRVHTEPTMRWHKYEPAWELSAETSVLATAYYQERLQENKHDTITRVLPRVRLNGQLFLEKPISWFGKPMTQTLEPRVQYLWVPQHDQDDIRFYDSTLLQDDFHGLFRVNRYSGVDRILEANQLTIGATSRLINDRNQEKLEFSIGQILFFNEPKGNIVDENEELARGESAVAMDLSADIRNTWFLHYGLQYDTQLEQTKKSQLTIDYRRDDGHFVQLSHRYAPNISNNKINMAGALGQWTIDQNWQVFASYYHDLTLSRNLESRLGFQYQSCCWGIQFSWQSSLLSELEADSLAQDEFSDEYDRGFMLRFTAGFGGNSRSNQQSLLQDGTFGYRRPYFLNQ